MVGELKPNRLLIDQIQQLSQRTIFGILASIINSSILAIVLWGIVPNIRIIIWLSSVIIIALTRLPLYFYFQDETLGHNVHLRRHYYFLITSIALSGIIWGSAAFIIFPYNSIVHQTFLAFVLGGMVAGSVGIFSILKMAFYGFVIPALLPITVIFFTIHDEIHYAMAAMVALFGIIMFMTVRKMNAIMIEAMSLKYKNLDLISDLEKEIKERKSAEERLKERNLEIEQIVENRTCELQNTNNQLMIEIEERKKAEKRNVESEKKFKDLANSLPQVIFESDKDGTLTYTNHNSTEFYKYTAEDFLKGINVFEMVFPSDRERARINFNKVLNGQDIGGIEYTALRRDGTTLPVVIHANQITRDNKPVGIRGLVIDLSEPKKAEEERKQLEAQLLRAQKMEAIGTLAGGVAHDLNNILSGVVSYPDLLLLQIPEDSPLVTPIRTIQNSGNKAAAIVQDLLTLTRRGVMNREVVNLNSIISDYFKSPEYEKMISFHSGVHIKTELSPDLLNIMGSSIHLTKTIMNLASNAAEALPNGGEVIISTKNRYIDLPIKGYDKIEEGDYVVLTVVDTGVGISIEDLDRIFEPFFTKKVMGRSGTGLGMAVVWGTVKDHNGYIDVQSAENEGTTFTLYFPVSRKEMAQKEIPSSLALFKGRGESVLVVDDIKEQREIASALLTQIGYSVSTATNGEEAIEYVTENSVDLIILDMIMYPGMDGLDTYRKIVDIHPGQKAIIASGFSETERVKETLELGAGEYIKKPYTLEKIGHAVRTELDK